MEGHEVAALMVRDADRARSLAERFGAGRATDDVNALVEADDVDAVYVSSPVHLHREHVLRAAAAGKHVLCEKPMADTSAACDEMIAVCREAGVTLGVCFVLRGWPIYRRIRSMIEDGAFGTLIQLRSHLAKWTPRDANEWRLDPARSGGGTLVDVATHYLDLFRFLAGEIDRVAYMGGARVFGWPVEETAHALLSFENGAHGMVTATCTVPAGGPLLEVFGTEATLTLGKTLTIVRDGEAVEEPVAFPDYYSGLLADFGEAVREGRDPIASGEDGRVGMAIVEAAYRSAREGRIEPIKD